MKPRFTVSTVLCLLALFGTVVPAVAAQFGPGAESLKVKHVRAELVSDVSAIAPGQQFTIALRLRMDPQWHVYWRNPGDAGMPPSLKWTLPEGFEAGEIQWPFPRLLDVPPLTSYAYDEEILLPVTIRPPAALEPGTAVELQAKASWLVCKEACIPGDSVVSLALTVAGEAVPNDEWTEAFSEIRSRLPLDESGWSVAARTKGRELLLSITPPEWYDESPGEVHFFPYDKGIIDYAAPQEISRTETGWQLAVKRSKNNLDRPEQLSGILVSENGWRGPGSERAIEFSAPVTEGEALASVGSTESSSSLWQALLFAFLGGIILNLMPCVLPVLSLKVLGFVKQAGEGRRSVLGHGLVFTAGVLVSFWALAGMLLALRAGGAELGWGFQLQSPVFLVVLSAFMFLFGLNLMGVFEVGTSLTAVGGAGRRTGMGGSFLNGVTATVVATPCTAPFMGSALGFSLTQPPFVAALIFTALGLGMAAPYVLLSAAPGLLKFVPKPGRWMESLKQFMGFLLMATVVWLAWVLAIQAGPNAVAALLIALVILGVAGWVYGRWGILTASYRTRVAASTISLLLLLGGVGFGILGVRATAVSGSMAAASTSGSLVWEPFSPERVNELRSKQQPVFIDFTAAWCLSCQVNEKVAFSSAEVQQRFAELNIATLKADWTSRDETITRALAQFGRNSVPLYVLYDEAHGKPIILPEILTPGVVLEALKKIES